MIILLYTKQTIPTIHAKAWWSTIKDGVWHAVLFI